MFFEDIKGDVYEYHEPKYIEKGEKYIDGGNKIVKDIFVTSVNEEKEVYYVELNSYGDKIFITEEVFDKLEKCLQESIEDIIDNNDWLYGERDYELFTIVKQEGTSKFNRVTGEYENYYICDYPAERIYSCSFIKFKYDWLNNNKSTNNTEQLEFFINEANKYKEMYEQEKKEKEKWHKKWDIDREYDSDLELNQLFYKENEDEAVFESEDIKYIEIKNNFVKDTTKCYGGQFTYFKANGENLTSKTIKEMVRNKKIPTYCGLPFRRMQDLYEIMKFLESTKYINYLEETSHIDFTSRIEFKNKKMYMGNVEINNGSIKNTIKRENSYIKFDNENIESYVTRKTLHYNNKEFTSVKELMKLLKEECYKNNKLLISIINNI